MLEWIKRFRADAPSAEVDDASSLKRASAELMAIAAYQDDDFEAVEKRTIEDLLQRRFDMTQAEAAQLIDEIAETTDGSSDLYTISRVIRDALPPDERVQIVELLWEVVYADGHLDDLEANLLRRVAGLLYVEDRDSGAARKRVMARLAIDGNNRNAD